MKKEEWQAKYDATPPHIKDLIDDIMAVADNFDNESITMAQMAEGLVLALDEGFEMYELYFAMICNACRLAGEMKKAESR